MSNEQDGALIASEVAIDEGGRPGRVVLVTGGSRGIGLACARRFQAGGDRVAVTWRTKPPDALDGPAGTHRLLPVSCDVTSPAEVERAFDEIEKALGPVQVLVCAAGITDDTLLLRMSEERWDGVIQTNLTAVYRTAKRALGPMVRARRGRIILISSVVAFMGSARPGQLRGFQSRPGGLRQIAGEGSGVALDHGQRGHPWVRGHGYDRCVRRRSRSGADVYGAARAASCPRRDRLGRRVPSLRRCQLCDRCRAGRGRWSWYGPLTHRNQPTDERKQPKAWTTKRHSRSSRPVRSRS